MKWWGFDVKNVYTLTIDTVSVNKWNVIDVVVAYISAYDYIRNCKGMTSEN